MSQETWQAKLQKLLKVSGHRVTDLAKMATVGNSYISRWRKGTLEPRPEKVRTFLTNFEKSLRRQLKRIQRIREMLDEASGEGRDRRKRSDLEVAFHQNGGAPELEVEGDLRSLGVHNRPRVVTYLLFRDGEVVYVGHSTNFFWRLGHHEREKQFDAYAYAEMETKREAIHVERALRRQLDPEYNVA